VFDRCFGLLYDLAGNRKRQLLSLIFLLTAASLAGLFLVEFDSSVELMIPRHEVIKKNLRFFRTSNLSGRVIISLGLAPGRRGTEDLSDAVRDVAASLDPELFTDVMAGVPKDRMSEELEALLSDLPRMFSEEDLSEIDAGLNREAVSGRLRSGYLQLLRPGGIFFESIVRSDPLGLRLIVLEKLKALSSSIGFDVRLREGRFISGDGRHAMIIAQTPIAVTDVSGADRMLGSLGKTLGGLPEDISADVICGHSHTLSNERVIKRDIRLTIAIASIAFFLLFVVVIGDVSAVLIYLIPVLSVLVSVNLSYLAMGSLSYSVIGLAAVIAGISVDYGIHMYIAARRGESSGAASRAVKHVAKPVVIGALTTTGIFFAFFFSSIQGYHQMALFSIISVVLALLYATVALPHFLSGRGGMGLLMKRLMKWSEDFRFSSGPAVVIWAILTLAFAWLALGVSFQSDITNVDGTEEEILKAEERFQDVWGQKKLAILVAPAKGREEALELGEEVYREASLDIGAGNVSSIASFLPSGKTGRENAERWGRFWKDGREERLRKLLKEEGAKYGFSAHAFDPFFETLYVGSRSSGKSQAGGRGFGLAERFLQEAPEGYRALMFFPDSKEHLDSMRRVLRSYPGTYVVSGNVLSETVSEVVSTDMKRMTKIAGAFVVLLTLMFLRSAREAAAALVPVATSVIWLLGGVAVLGLSLNVANLVAYIVVMGLCVDYGIFMAYKCRADMRTGTVLAVTLSAVSTLVGAGVLLFTKHPALFSIGITLVIGVSAGYLSSVFVVPWIYDFLMGRTGKGGAA
jgi:predicted exporter